LATKIPCSFSGKSIDEWPALGWRILFFGADASHGMQQWAGGFGQLFIVFSGSDWR
jgi:hypothetical protein